MSLRVIGGLLGLGVVGAVALGGCQGGPVATADRVLTGTVALGNETALVLNAPVAIEIVGNRRLDEIHYRAELTVTASAGDTAERAAAALELSIEPVTAERLLRITLPGTTDSISGTIVLEVPADLDLGLNGGATVQASAMDGSYDVRALSTVVITGAQKSVTVRNEGGISVTSLVAPSSITDLETGSGTVEMVLPPLVSAQFAAASVGGQIAISHPQLPPWAGGGQPYQVSINGGLALVRLVTQSGDIVIRGQ